MSRAQQMLVHCAEEGNEAGVQQAVQAGASLDWVARDGWAALHHAAASGNSGMVGLLLNYSADPDVRSTAMGEEGATSLHLAACLGNTVVMRLLLDGGADCEAVDHRGKTAVHWAALQGKLESLKLLDTYNCDLRARVSGRGTALHYAAAYGDLELVEWLVERGVEIASKDKNGRLPKDVAKRNGHMLVHHFLKEAGRQTQKSVGRTSRAKRASRTDDIDHLPQPRPRRNTQREGRDAPSHERIQEEENRSASLPPATKPLTPATSKKKGWIRSMSLGNKSGQKLQAEAMKKGMEDMEEIIRSKNEQIARLQGDIFSTELEKVKVEEQLQELMAHTRRVARPLQRQDAVLLEGASNTGDFDVDTLLQEKAALLSELQEVKTKLEEEREARASERQANDLKIASLTSELEEVTQKMTKYGVRQRKLLSKNKTVEPDLTAARTPSGLPDLGDAGAMNSVIQCLYSVVDFRNYLTSDAYRRDLVSQGEAATALAGVFKALRAGVQPEIQAKVCRLKEVVCGSQETSSRGHGRDTHDLLTYLFTRLQRDLWQVDEDSVSRKFLGSQMSTVTCRWTGSHVSRVTEDFSTITLDIVKDMQSSLQDMLAEHYRALNVEQDCPYCVRSHQCRKQVTITRFPPVLVIHVARNDQKNKIAFPLRLSLQGIAGCEGSSYELLAVIALCGMNVSSNYTAMCRSDPDSTWRLYDDDKVCEVSVQKVLDIHNPQLLFYSAEKD